MNITKDWNNDFFDGIWSILRDARQKAYGSVNFMMVEAYWKIGQRIVEEEQQGRQRADYGDFLIRELSRRLGDEFGKGFSVANLKNFRQFYVTFPQLERNIATGWYERLLKPPIASQPVTAKNNVVLEFIKDPYVQEFLGLPECETVHESELESAIIAKLQHFLLELGKGFSFVGRQFRISSETSHFYIDLVFYNYLLKTRGIDEHGNLRSEETHIQRFPLGRIPVEWEVSILNDCVPTVAPICYGILMPGQGHDGGIPVIKVKDVIGGRIIQNDILLTDPKIDAQYSRSRLRDGDLLLTIRGTTGRVAIVPPELNGANITQDTARIRLKDGFSHFSFYFLMQSIQLQDQIKLHTLGQAVKGINIGEVKRLSFGVPDKTEQFEISTRLMAIQQLLDSSEERFRKLRSLKTALMQDLLTGKVRVTPLLEKMKVCS